jgi:hypothetical protein
MSPYTDFKLYWEEWGGYADRAEPFGNPSLLWLLAHGENAMACKVYRTIRGSHDIADHARWQRVPYADIAALPGLLEELGALDALCSLQDMSTLVASNPEGEYPEGIYRCEWDLTGTIGSRPFHFSVNYCTPGETWTPLGRRLCNALFGVKSQFDAA